MLYERRNNKGQMKIFQSCETNTHIITGENDRAGIVRKSCQAKGWMDENRAMIGTKE